MKRWLLAGLMLFSSLSFAQDFSQTLGSVEELQVFTLDNGQKILANAEGLTVYTFDVDVPGESRCFDSCLVAWPAVTTEKDSLPAPFGVHVRPDGVKQIMLNDQPLYLFISDAVPGDILGDGLNGVWHIVKAE